VYGSKININTKTIFCIMDASGGLEEFDFRLVFEEDDTSCTETEEEMNNNDNSE
jgi:hypothetical protein